MSKQKRLIKTNIANFKARWDNWRTLLQTLVEEPAGQFICPTSRELIFEQQQQSIQVKLPYAICLYGIPLKLNNKNSGKIAIFIDGNYELEQDKEENLRRIKSSVAFYSVSSGRDSKSLKLMDAYHFDFFEDLPENHAPHPVFHAQRNIRCNEAELRFNATLQSIPALEQIAPVSTKEGDKTRLFPFGAFRIPTPQLDIFNLGAVVAADQLVGHDCDKRWGRFRKLLDVIHGKEGASHHVKIPAKHNAGIYKQPRRGLSDWYSART